MAGKRKRKFRIGQAVASIYDPQRAFRIDESVSPERLFHEEGSDRWYTRTELLALGRANERPRRVDAATLAAAGRTRSLAFRGISGKQLVEGTAVKVAETRKCLECEAEFTPRRKRQKFCCDSHRTTYWKRQNRSHAEAEAIQVLTATA
jgi:hypothetical protein